MVVLEAPTAAEDHVGAPLQGRPGQFLKEMLELTGIEDFYVTYAVKCLPSDRAPSARELKTCKAYLEKEIEQVKPTHILTLGANALKTLMGRAKITEMHGQVLEYGDAVLVPTFHPGAVLRDPTRLPGFRSDILKFGNAIRGEVPNDEDIHWEVIRTLDKWNEVIEEVESSNEIALDIETTGLDRNEEGAAINSIQFSLPNGHNYALPLSVRDGPWRNKPAVMQDMVETLIDLCEGKVVIGHNFKFDNLWVKKIFGRKFTLRFDTMLAHHILDENSPHGLKQLSVQYCNAPAYDIDLKTKLGKGNLEQFYKYGCKDTYYTLQLYYIFRKQLLKDMSLRRLFYKLVMPTARMFEDVEEEGLFINMDKLQEVKKHLEDEKAKRLEKLSEFGEVNWNSPAQIAKLLYEDLGLPIIETTAKGAPSTSESVLLRLQSEHEVPKLLIEYRGIEKNLSTYVLGWEKLMHGDRLYLSTKIHGTVTGRFASRLHQVPRNPMIRSLIDAPPGWKFLQADYSQIELRLAAHLANDRQMKHIFQTDGDIHSATASVILGKPVEKLTKEERKMAKAVNFGLLYGMGAPKLVIYARDNYGVDMTPGQAKAFRTRYFENYSGLLPWHERQRNCVRTFGQVVSLSGRIRRLPGIHSSDQGVRAEAERQSINSPVQGFGSGDLKAMGMIEIHETFGRDEVQIKGEVHDSVLMWVRDEIWMDVVPQIKAIMESPKLLKDFRIKMSVPLKVDLEIGPWGNGKELEFKGGKLCL